MDPTKQQDNESESKSHASSFETYCASQSTEIAYLDTLEIDKRLCSDDTEALVRTEKYSETFLNVTPPTSTDLTVVENSTFMAYSPDAAKDYAN